MQAVRAGGPDPISNIRLRDLIAVAKERNVPKDIVDRNIKRASEVKTDFSEVWCTEHGLHACNCVVFRT